MALDAVLRWCHDPAQPGGGAQYIQWNSLFHVNLEFPGLALHRQCFLAVVHVLTQPPFIAAPPAALQFPDFHALTVSLQGRGFAKPNWQLGRSVEISAWATVPTVAHRMQTPRPTYPLLQLVSFVGAVMPLVYAAIAFVSILVR